MNTQELIDELRLQMKEAQDKAREIKLNIQNEGNSPCIKLQGRTFFDSDYISFEEHLQIVELEKFLLKHNDLNDRDLRFIFGGNVFYFSFLEELLNSIPGLAKAIRNFGADVVAGMFVGTRLEHANKYEL